MSGVVYRLGRVIGWTASGLAAITAAGAAIFTTPVFFDAWERQRHFDPAAPRSEFSTTPLQDMHDTAGMLGIALGAALLIYLLGRGARYVLTGE